jgi:hypothetical protein
MCRSCVNWYFGRTYHLHLQPPAHAGSSLADFYTLKMEAICSSKTSVNTRSTWCHIQENGILHSHRCENFKSYNILSFINSTHLSKMGWRVVKVCSFLQLNSVCHNRVFSIKHFYTYLQKANVMTSTLTDRIPMLQGHLQVPVYIKSREILRTSALM